MPECIIFNTDAALRFIAAESEVARGQVDQEPAPRDL